MARWREKIYTKEVFSKLKPEEYKLLLRACSVASLSRSAFIRSATLQACRDVLRENNIRVDID